MQSGVMKKAGDALQYRWPIAVAIIALALGCGVLAAELTPTQYKAEAQLYVDPTKNSVALNASDGLLNGYFTQQVTARHVVKRALASLAAAESSNQHASDLGGNPTVDQVASRNTATAVRGTTAIAIDATGPTASGAANIANAVAKAVIDQYRDDAAQRYVNSDQFLQGELTRLSKLINQDISPEQLASDRAQYQTTYNNFQTLQIQQVNDVGSLSITEQAQPPTEPSSPDLARNAAIVLLAGLVIGLAILPVELRQGAGAVEFKIGQDPCAETACARQDGAPCEYVGRRSRECLTAWCPEHQYVVGEAVYCRRHATVMAALLTLPEEDRERPDLDNRAPSLLEYVARRLHQPAVQMLQARGAGSPGSSIVVYALHMTMAGTPRIRGWEHRWRLLDHTGPLATIGIRVDEDTDSLVQVKVDGAVVHTAEPPWIAARTAGSDEEDAARRQAYEQELINAMFESLQHRHEFRY